MTKNCRNCGAPKQSFFQIKCNYCGTAKPTFEPEKPKESTGTYSA